MTLLPALLLLFAEDSSEPIDKALKRFVDAFAIVRENAADPISTAQAIYEGAIPGMLKQLDPHSVFFDPVQFEQLKELENSTRKGFGSVVSVLPGRVIVLQTLPGTPSAKSGLSPGDEIFAINGYRLDRLEFDQLIQLLGAARQRQALIDVRRPGNARPLQLVLTPEDVDSPSVDRAYLLEPGIAYIRVASFDAQTGKHIAQTIEKLGGRALRGLVMDLRNNPGGVLPAALETAALFLNSGQQILSVRGRSVQGQEINVPEKMDPYTFPLSILINNKSASASEIVAGAMQDHKRAFIVGETSYGKGLVQSVYPLSQGTGIALTTAFYHTPKGRNIQRPLPGQLAGSTSNLTGGIAPDETVLPEPITRLRAFLDASGLFVSFATEYIQRNRSVDTAFEVSNAVLDQFQSFLTARNVQPGVSEWSTDREWIRGRMRQEIFNQALGVEKGDEIEAQRDPVVIAAREAVKRAASR